jgi:hypothetical protein
MNDAEIISRLEALRGQKYPLLVTAETAEALYLSIRRVMSVVPEDDHVLVRADYSLATSALFHPEPGEGGNFNEIRR